MSNSYPPLDDRFPRSAKYNPDWLLASISGAANPLWLTEWLTSALDLRPGMRVLDLGCGRAVSSIFLRQEYGVEVWATDLWFSASENAQRIRDAGVAAGVYPIHADARSLPFATEFFDVIVSLDSFCYYGTNDLYLSYIARFLKPGGTLAIAGAGLTQEIPDAMPQHLQSWWTPDLWCLHSAAWWRRHWERTGILTINLADAMPNGCQVWLDWHRIIAPLNTLEIEALQADAGQYLGYVRAIGQLQPGIKLSEPIVDVKTDYSNKPLLLRGAAAAS